MIEILNKIYIFLYNFINFFKKRSQKIFYEYERYNQTINLNGIRYFNFKDHILSEKNLIKSNFFSKSLKKNFKNVIIILSKKTSNFFTYKIDKKTFKRFILNNSINFLKIDLKGKKQIEFNIQKSDLIFKPIFSKKKNKKKLVLILIVDGLGNDFTSIMKNTSSYFGKNNRFENAWSNAEWTLPSVGNLLTGKYTSNHLCWKNLTFYKSRFNRPNKMREQVYLKENDNIFSTFKKLDFVTGFYSPYIRINPTYAHDKDVDIFKFCRECSVDEILDNVSSQIEFFNNNSNFVIAHIFDSKGPTKKYLRLSEQSESSDKNYNYSTKKEIVAEMQNLTLKNLQVRDRYQGIMSENLFRYVDNRLGNFFRNLEKKKFDDYTIMLFGDHGTRRVEKNKTNKVLSSMQNNIGFYIKDKKFNFKSKRKKILQMIDIFPSLLSRYSSNKFKNENKLDGKNILYSSKKSKYFVSESIWGKEYKFFVKTKNLFSLFTHDINELRKIKYINFFDDKENEVDEKSISKKTLQEIKNIFKNFKKSKKFFNNI